MPEVEMELVAYEYGRRVVVGTAKVRMKTKYIGLVKEIQLDRKDSIVRYLMDHREED